MLCMENFDVFSFLLVSDAIYNNKNKKNQKGYLCFFIGVLVADYMKWQNKDNNFPPLRSSYYFLNNIDDRYAII